MSILKVDIKNNKEWNDFLINYYNIYYDYKFISYNDHFNKEIYWHHLIFKDSQKNKINAILNGCESIENGNKIYISCNGVSFGGFIWRTKLDLIDYINTIKELKEYLKENGFSKCIIRNKPNNYQKNANEEYEYSLVYEGFSVSKYTITNIIELKDFEFELLASSKKRAIQKSGKNIHIEILTDNISTSYLNKYYDVLLKDRELKNVRATHSLEELVYLKRNLNERINLFSAKIDDNIVGVCILFIISQDVVLNFYLASDENYKKERVSDYLLFKTIEWAKNNHFRLYDIGTSNIGSLLLEGLFEFKKKFRANGFLRNTFEINL